MKDTLFGKTLQQLQEVVKNFGMPAYTATQLAEWLYKKDITSFEKEAMASITKYIVISVVQAQALT